MYPLAMGPKDHIFRKMLVLSGAFHVAAFIVGVVWVSIRVSPLLVAPVTVVDLIGNGQFAASEETQPSPPPASSPLSSCSLFQPVTSSCKMSERRNHVPSSLVPRS